jgi:ADP-ribose pyrophosphatase
MTHHDSASAPGTTRTYTHPDVFTLGVAQGWAEAETDPARIDWPARQAWAAIPFEVIEGRPVNPCQETGIRYGRNEMGFWGEQLMADALVTVTCGGVRALLMVERDDGYGWAVPGGHVEPGETALHAAVRELAEETGLAVTAGAFLAFTAGACRAMPPRYVPDPRASDEAWAVTVPLHVDLGALATPPAVTGSDDARRAEWVAADSYPVLTGTLARCFDGQVFAAHVDMLRGFLGEVTR